MKVIHRSVTSPGGVSKMYYGGLVAAFHPLWIRASTCELPLLNIRLKKLIQATTLILYRHEDVTTVHVV